MITPNDVVRFFLELAAFAALGYWAWALDTAAWARVLIAVGRSVVYRTPRAGLGSFDTDANGK